jgi:hypothetical protein
MPLPFAFFPSEPNMTSEELNRTIEFIIQQEARVAVQLEDLVRAQRRDREWAKRLIARDNALIQEHAARLKWWEDFMREEREWRRNFEETMQKRDEEMRKRDQEAQKRHEESLARLDRIIDKLSDRKN